MKTNHTVTRALDAQIIAGIQKDLQGVTALTLAGTSIAPADLVKLVQSRIDAADAVAAAKAKWNDAVQAYRVLDGKVAPLVKGLRSYLLNTYGPTSGTFADFGLSPPKTAVKSPEVKAAAAQKAQATRAARHTMGKNQKKAIKGTVSTTVAAQPSTGSPPVAQEGTASAPASPAASASPAPRATTS